MHADRATNIKSASKSIAGLLVGIASVISAAPATLLVIEFGFVAAIVAALVLHSAAAAILR